MDDAYLALPGPTQRDGARERLAAIFAADHARERARASRQGLLALLGVLGLPLWLSVVWPARLPAGAGTLVATAWAVAFATLLVASGWELFAYRRRARQIATLGPLPVLRSPDAARPRLAPRPPKTKTERREPRLTAACSRSMRLPGRQDRPSARPPGASGATAPTRRRRRLAAARDYALATALVALATGIGALARMQLPELVMLYLLGVVIAAARFGRGPSLLAATLSIVVFDFFFIPPTFTFTVTEDRHVLTFAIMLVVGLLTSGLTLRIRKQEQEARSSEGRIATLYQLSRDLTAAIDAPQAARATARHAAEICAGAALVLAPDGEGGLQPLAHSGPELSLDDAERAAIARTLDQPAHAGSSARLTWVPLSASAEVLGVLVLAPRDPALAREPRELLDAFARLAALALERARLAKRAEEAAVRAHTEETRSSLLSAVSHDLRTPLAAITGAATTLRDSASIAGAQGDGGVIDDAQRADLLDTICEEADRLERLVRNLLDLTRLESGALEVRREWMPLEEIVGSALMRLEARLQGRPIRTDLPADLPLIPVDAVLVEQALVNLLENAAKYTPAGSEIAIVARADDQPVVPGVAQSVVIDVADRGPGLEPGEEARIFDKFFRGRNAGPTGAGLGLAICRGVAHAHRGTLTVANRAGGGALFRLSLPLIGKPPAPPPDEMDAALGAPEAPT